MVTEHGVMPSQSKLGKGLWSRLRSDSRGSTAVIVAFALPVILGSLSIGVDTGIWYMEKRKLQQASDASALGAVRALFTGADVEAAKQVARNDIKRNGYVANDSTTITINSPPTSGAYVGKKGAVEIIIERKLPLFFSAYFLSQGSTLKARSVGYQNSKLGRNLEVAMMLDVSTSMGGNSEVRNTTKLEAMQEAAKSLVDTVVQPTQTPFTSRVAIAPYSSAVNVGSAYYKKVTNKTASSNWTSVTERSGTSAYTDDLPAANKWLGAFKTTKANARGAYSSTVKNYSSNVPSSSKINPLTTEKQTLKDTIDEFSANGTTAGHLGIAWTWYLLSPKWSSIWTDAATPAAYDATKTLKVAVLLSDFDMNSYYASGDDDSTDQSRKLCTAMKAAGVTIYTVGYGLDTNNSTAKKLWEDCATDADKRYKTTTVDGLIQAFKDIAYSAVGGASIIIPAVVE